MQLLLKILSGIANNGNPEQTAVCLGLHYLHIPFCQEPWCTKFLDIYCSPEKDLKNAVFN